MLLTSKTLLLQLLFLFISHLVLSQDLSQGYIANDLEQHPMIPLAKPGYLSSVVDPSFQNTVVRRISEAPNNSFIVPVYSTIQAWNANESKLVVYGGGTHKLLNGTDYTFIRDLSDINPDDLEGVFWHFSNPDVLFYMDKNTLDLISYNVNTQVKTILVNLKVASGCTGSLTGGDDLQMMSWDSDVFSFRSDNTSAFYYRISTGVTTEFTITDINSTAPMPFSSGNLFFHQEKVYDANGNFVRSFNTNKGEHSCLGKLSNGDDALFVLPLSKYQVVDAKVH